MDGFLSPSVAFRKNANISSPLRCHFLKLIKIPYRLLSVVPVNRNAAHIFKQVTHERNSEHLLLDRKGEFLLERDHDKNKVNKGRMI